MAADVHTSDLALSVEIVARELWNELERLDPGDGVWATLPEHSRRLYRAAVKRALRLPEARVVAETLGR